MSRSLTTIHQLSSQNKRLPLKDNKEEARKVIQAIKKGYQYAMEHPEEAADILIKNAPELKEKRDFVIESQKYLSKEYASDKEKWGAIWCSSLECLLQMG